MIVDYSQTKTGVDKVGKTVRYGYAPNGLKHNFKDFKTRLVLTYLSFSKCVQIGMSN